MRKQEKLKLASKIVAIFMVIAMILTSVASIV